ncbi:MAG: RNA pseudouridine synthase [Planctomycetaceae bacterium]|nr:RNA pseudouridine synthase [Planctomycetaceae bacterium]
MSHAPRLLYESGPCFVFYKPAGLSTQAPPGIDSAEVQIKQWLRDREQKPGNVYLGMPHRLDRPVSGALLVARHVRACRRLSEQFEDRTVRKIYWACVAGIVEPAEGRWIDWLRKIPSRAHVEVVDRDHAEGQAAILNYRTLGATQNRTWLEIELETGRTHQIRVQTASRGWPILGDAQYGSATSFGPATDDPRARAIALHGRSLEFRHPMTQEPQSVVAPLPVTWRELELSVGTDEYIDPQ